MLIFNIFSALIKHRPKQRQPTFKQFKESLLLPVENHPSFEDQGNSLFSLRAIIKIEGEVLSKAKEINDNERMRFFPSFNPNNKLRGKGLEMLMFEEGYRLFLDGVCVVWWFINFQDDSWFINAEVAGQRWFAADYDQQLTPIEQLPLNLGQVYKSTL